MGLRLPLGRGATSSSADAAQSKQHAGRASAAFDKAWGLLVVAALTMGGFGIVSGLIYAAVVWSLLALIPLVVYLTAWLLVARTAEKPGAPTEKHPADSPASSRSPAGRCLA
jgi:hypothetical protein